jgi:hypothetical protein
VIACGTGGTLVELFADVVLRLHPITDIDAAEMINELRGVRLLRGYRGSAPADELALARGASPHLCLDRGMPGHPRARYQPAEGASARAPASSTRAFASAISRAAVATGQLLSDR